MESTLILKKRVLLPIISSLIIGYSSSSYAETTWIPISNGGLTFIIPYIPTAKFQAPSGLKIEKLNGVSKLSWADIQHASKYKIEVENASGQWIEIEITENSWVYLDSKYYDYQSIRVTACTYNSCNNSGYASSNQSIDLKPTYIYQYDALGRLICVQRANNSETKYSFDDAGNRQSVSNSCN